MSSLSCVVGLSQLSQTFGHFTGGSNSPTSNAAAMTSTSSVSTTTTIAAATSALAQLNHQVTSCLSSPSSANANGASPQNGTAVSHLEDSYNNNNSGSSGSNNLNTRDYPHATSLHPSLHPHHHHQHQQLHHHHHQPDGGYHGFFHDHVGRDSMMDAVSRGGWV